jgi:hypothetical protein
VPLVQARHLAVPLVQARHLAVPLVQAVVAGGGWMWGWTRWRGRWRRR